jgi:NAD(P)-dependent dehydrogenase (short-subunit alcohol dehydrogenase family)
VPAADAHNHCANDEFPPVPERVGAGNADIEHEHEAEHRGRDNPVAVMTGAGPGLGFLLGVRSGRPRPQPGRQRARRTASPRRPPRPADPEGSGRRRAGDISDAEVAERLVTAATGRFGRLDVLVADAGVIQVGPVQAMGPDDFAEAMDVM